MKSQITIPARASEPRPASSTSLVTLAVPLLLAATIAVGAIGCRKSDPLGEGAPLTGKASDPPVTFTGRWDDTNAFVYHLETITGTQVPRRNSEVVVQQDTVLAKDFRMGVTNITREGVRALTAEIQSVRVETTSDQRLTSAFDTENELLSTEDNAIANRLRRVKGARLGFKLAPAGRVVRVDGVKEFNDRVGASRNIRGAAGAVLNKFLSPEFYRDLVEMTFLPANPVRIGDSWTVRPRSGLGMSGNTGPDLVYTFRGWQVREGTNCARFDFVGGKAAGNSGSTSNVVIRRSAPDNLTTEGTLWFSPDLGVPVEMIYSQSFSKQSVVNPSNAPRVVRTQGPGPTNSAAVAVMDVDDDADSAPTNAPAASVRTVSASAPATTPITRTITTQQHVTLTLIELVPVEPPPSPVAAPVTAPAAEPPKPATP